MIINVDIGVRQITQGMSDKDILELIDRIDLYQQSTDFTLQLIKERIASLVKEGANVEEIKKELFP